MDPPYEPVSRTANFTSYAQDGFSQADQTRLRDVFRELDRRGAKLMLSNSDVPFIRELYRGFQIDTGDGATCRELRREHTGTGEGSRGEELRPLTPCPRLAALSPATRAPQHAELNASAA